MLKNREGATVTFNPPVESPHIVRLGEEQVLPDRENAAMPFVAPVARVTFAQTTRLDKAQTLQELKSALSGTEPVDLGSAAVKAAIARVTES